jgi:hypothetical protein
LPLTLADTAVLDEIVIMLKLAVPPLWIFHEARAIRIPAVKLLPPTSA